MHAWLTVGPVSAEKETTYGVRVCAPSCASPWAGIAIGTITVVPTGTPSDDVGAPGTESPDAESGMPAGRELAYVGLAVLTGVIAHHAEVSPGRAEAGQRVDVTARAIPHDTTRLTDCQLLWDGTPGGSCSADADADGGLTGEIAVPKAAAAGDHNDDRNVVIVATSIGLALLVTVQPDVAKAVPGWAQIIFGSGITLGSLTAIVLNALFHHVGKGRGPAVAGRPGEGTVRLDEVNAMSESEFVETFRRLFQGPCWVVANAYQQRPFADNQALRMAFQEALFSGTPEQQQELMRHYPALGGDAVADGQSGEDSLRDQSALGLDRLVDSGHEEFEALTRDYEDKFGIPLIVCVRDNQTRAQVLRNGRGRLANSAKQEHAAALIEIVKIAKHRSRTSWPMRTPFTPPARSGSTTPDDSARRRSGGDDRDDGTLDRGLQRPRRAGGRGGTAGVLLVA